MKTDCFYEIVDSRPGKALGPVGKVASVPGGLQVSGVLAPKPEVVPILDDEGMFLDDEQAGVLLLETPEGRIVFNRLTLDIWNEHIEPLWGDVALPFQTEAELYRFLDQKLVEG